MPEYLYEDPDTGKIVTVIQGINEEHKYQEDGKEFNRLFIVLYHFGLGIDGKG